ncbi:orotate phosphoribosyltransferase [Mycoplasma sp. SG1]|uniref:orotate phosphoribosyltransferase n=1 Tax=Mycoplasma sp. SG1 TaxID=2810348 RepID=UPI002024CF29|nr:phosphoribosyltransferase family protein [Mycoplasma sp. SG1]URM52826.1 hypothetical protein JRW51_00570 [Mycoplasma sp. SG1]
MKNIAKLLVQCKVINLNFVNKYKWSSGVISPIYIDNRILFSKLKERDIIWNNIADLVKRHFPTATFISGISTASIGHAVAVSYLLNLKSGYVRPTQKIHGTRKNIEGEVSLDDQIVIIEDVIATGLSTIQTINIFENHGYKVLGVISIFNYLTHKSEKNLHDYKIHSLTNINEVVESALEENKITQNDAVQLQIFLNTL